MLRIRTIAAATTALTILAATPSQAGTVDMAFLDIGAGRQMNVVLNGQANTTFAGQLYHEFSNGTGDLSGLHGIFATFCTELTQSMSKDAVTYQGNDVPAAPLSGPMGEIKAAAIRDLFAFAEDRQFAKEKTAANKDFAAAFQLAVWEVVHDYDGTSESLNRKAGTLKFGGKNGKKPTAGLLAALNDLFGAVGSNSSYANVLAATNQSFQDQLVQTVPLPAPVLLGAVGLAGVVWHRRRRAQRA